jgi:hypothetical protein
MGTKKPSDWKVLFCDPAGIVLVHYNIHKVNDLLNTIFGLANIWQTIENYFLAKKVIYRLSYLIFCQKIYIIIANKNNYLFTIQTLILFISVYDWFANTK